MTFTLKIEPDDSPSNPRTDFDNASTMLCSHKRYDLGDNNDFDWDNYSSWAGALDGVMKEYKPRLILPLYLYDHSGITISTTPYSCPWDSGQIGYVFMTGDQIRETYMVQRITAKVLERAKELVLAEVREYDQYLRGEVYGYIIENEEGDTVESCWGYYGYETAEEDGKSSLKHIETTENAKKDSEKLFTEGAGAEANLVPSNG